MGVIYVNESPPRYTEDQAREAMRGELERLQRVNPATEFVLSENGLTVYWHHPDGFDYGLSSYTLDGYIETVWDGNTSYIWRKWRPDADDSNQIAADPDQPATPMPGAVSPERT
jgi:hypothetical protein